MLRMITFVFICLESLIIIIIYSGMHKKNYIKSINVQST